MHGSLVTDHNGDILVACRVKNFCVDLMVGFNFDNRFLKWLRETLDFLHVPAGSQQIVGLTQKGLNRLGITAGEGDRIDIGPQSHLELSRENESFLFMVNNGEAIALQVVSGYVTFQEFAEFLRRNAQ